MFFYPTLTDELKEASGIEVSPYYYTYTADGYEHKLLPKGKSTIKFDDEDWKIERDGLRIRRKISIEYPEMLYGPNGIACTGADLGACIIWVNHSLTQMGTVLPINECLNENIKCFEFDHEFKQGEIKGDLQLDLQLFIRNSAEDVNESESHLINDEGVTVGILDETRLDFGSAYMEFPIQEVKSSKHPLWWLDIGEWTDPTSDLFNEDNLCIYLNTTYEGCPKLGDTIKNVDMLIEIITSAYVMLFKRIEDMGYLQQTLNDVNLEPGSISKILFYFKDSCETDIDFSSTEKMQQTIWMNVLSMLSGGEEQ